MSISSSSDSLRVVLCTCPTREAKSLAQTLVERHLAACVNILPSVQSVYRWQDAVVDEAEAQLVIKTTLQRSEALFSQLAELHPYEVPEIISLPSDSVFPAYLEWVHEQTQP